MYELENYISYPNSLEDSKITKKTIFNNIELKSKDKTLFKKIQRITWLYSLKKSNSNINPYSDEEKEYLEFEVIEIEMRKKEDTERISDILQRFIPYPTLLIFHFHEQLQLSVAHQRESQSDSSKITLTEHRMTDWINLIELDDLDEKLFTSLQIENLNKTNFYTLYSDIVNIITLYNGSKQIGKPLTIEASQVKEINNQIYEIDKELRKLKAEIKKETQFNKQTQLNMQIHELKQQKDNLKSQLK